MTNIGNISDNNYIAPRKKQRLGHFIIHFIHFIIDLPLFSNVTY